ncbi:MAG: dCMP deaminase family protein [Thermodesulfovibrionales bacterium]|nr:dCMP deaminase family protein [Thermodesulfovibrionales bacterium]
MPKKKKSKRPGWDEYFIGIAKAVATRATCLRRKYGAVITKDNIIVSTGYNGAPAGMKDCLEVGKCTRKELQIPHGERYELCHSVHAEANAVIRAAVHELKGATIYISGAVASFSSANPPECGGDSPRRDDSIGECLSEPCMMCKRIILNARIARVVYSDGNGNSHVINPKEWLKKRV